MTYSMELKVEATNHTVESLDKMAKRLNADPSAPKPKTAPSWTVPLLMSELLEDIALEFKELTDKAVDTAHRPVV